jgi:hypothetical protein
MAVASTNIACGQTPKKTPKIPLLLHGVITGTDPKENIVSDPLLLHDVITGTDHKENTGRFHCCESVATQRPSSVVFVGPQSARHSIIFWDITYCLQISSASNYKGTHRQTHRHTHPTVLILLRVCRGNVFVERHLSPMVGIHFIEPLPSNDRGIHIQTHGLVRGIYEVRR